LRFAAIVLVLVTIFLSVASTHPLGVLHANNAGKFVRGNLAVNAKETISWPKQAISWPRMPF
jgi:hypothetical protein